MKKSCWGGESASQLQTGGKGEEQTTRESRKQQSLQTGAGGAKKKPRIQLVGASTREHTPVQCQRCKRLLRVTRPVQLQLQPGLYRQHSAQTCERRRLPAKWKTVDNGSATDHQKESRHRYTQGALKRSNAKTHTHAHTHTHTHTHTHLAAEAKVRGQRVAAEQVHEETDQEGCRVRLWSLLSPLPCSCSLLFPAKTSRLRTHPSAISCR